MNKDEIKDKLKECLTDEVRLDKLADQISGLFEGRTKKVQFMCDLHSTLSNKPVSKEVLEELDIGVASYYRLKKHEVS